MSQTPVNPFATKKAEATETKAPTPFPPSGKSTAKAPPVPKATPTPPVAPAPPSSPVMGGADSGSVSIDDFFGDNFNFDFSGVAPSSGGGGYIAPGRHLMYVSEISFGTSKAGNPKIVFKLTVYSGDYEGKWKESHLAYQENTLWKVDQYFRALGLMDTETKRQLSKAELLEEAPYRLVIGEFVAAEPYNGNPASDLVTIHSTADMGIEPGTKVTDR